MKKELVRCDLLLENGRKKARNEKNHSEPRENFVSYWFLKLLHSSKNCGSFNKDQNLPDFGLYY